MNNILFDSDHCIQMVDFRPIVLEVCENESESEEGTQHGSISRERRTLETDIQAFTSVLFELMFGRPPQGKASIPWHTQPFVSGIIKSGLSPISGTSSSFGAIFNILKQNNFHIEDGVDSAEVSAFVSWVECAE
jgi:hypothetical protein